MAFTVMKNQHLHLKYRVNLYQMN